MTNNVPAGVALITGVGRRRSIGAGLAVGLASDGWDLALNYWRPYDERLGYERNADDPESIAEQLPDSVAPGEVGGRIVALTSDLTAHNLPYGASKGALDRIVIAATVELADRGVRANVINPGPVETGWMDDDIRASGIAATPAGRLGTAADTANLVRFLFSEPGSWINGQLLYSNGGFKTS